MANTLRLLNKRRRQDLPVVTQPRRGRPAVYPPQVGRPDHELTGRTRSFDQFYIQLDIVQRQPIVAHSRISDIVKLNAE